MMNILEIQAKEKKNLKSEKYMRKEIKAEESNEKL